MGENSTSVNEFEKNEVADYAIQSYGELQTLEASSEEEKVSPNAQFAVKE